MQVVAAALIFVLALLWSLAGAISVFRPLRVFRIRNRPQGALMLATGVAAMFLSVIFIAVIGDEKHSTAYNISLFSTISVLLLLVASVVAFILSPTRGVAKWAALGCAVGLVLGFYAFESNYEAERKAEKARAAGFASVAEWQSAENAKAAQIKADAERIASEKNALEERRRNEERAAEDQRRAERERRAAEEKAAEESRCANDVNCLASRFLSEATSQCPPAIERLAINDFKWMDSNNSWVDPKFTRVRAGSEKSIITFVGDKIKYQNGFGAWTWHTYECDINVKTNKAVAVRAYPGRLPN
jgi:hypothetical protein